jgi:hypothetical protein
MERNPLQRRADEEVVTQERPAPTPATAAGPEGVLALQRTAGNQAVAGVLARAPAAPAAGVAEGGDLDSLEARWIAEDVDEIVGLLREQILSSSEEARIVAIARRWGSLTPGAPTTRLDRFLLALRMRVFTRRTARSGWVEQHVNAYDTIWHELEDSNLAAFRELVAPSKHGGAPGSGPSENLWATLGKHEAMGVWGMLKGMGLVVAGVADAAVWAYWKTTGLPLRIALERMGVKDTDTPPSITPYLTKSYDEVAALMGTAMGVDPKRDDTLLGQSSYEIGELGGKVVGMLTMAGVTAGGAGGNLSAGAKVLGVAGAGKGIDDAGQAIDKRLAELQKRTPPPTLADILTDQALLLEMANVLANLLGAMSGASEVLPPLSAAIKRFGLVVDAAQLAPVVAKAYKDYNDPELAKDPEARAAALRDAAATILGTLLSTGASKGDEARGAAAEQRAAEQAAFNAEFDARYNARPDGPEVIRGTGVQARPPESTIVPGAEGMHEFSPEDLGGRPDYDGNTYNHEHHYDTGDKHQAAAKAQLQKIVHSTLTPDGPDSLVKVVPIHYGTDTEVGGYVVKRKFVTGRTPEQLADMLGVAQLTAGVKVYGVDLSAVKPDMLQLRGYTQSSGGKSPNLSTAFDLVGYPVGQGASQWELTAKVKASVIGEAQPGERFAPR